jgi:hypothetical protein
MPYFAILLKKFQPVRSEAIAAAAIYPGELVMLDSAGKFALNTASDINARGALIAVEDELQGKDKSDQYASASLVQAEQLQPGDEVQVMLDSTAPAAISIGDRLHPNAGGTVAELANGSFVALEAVSTATGAADQLIKARYVG